MGWVDCRIVDSAFEPQLDRLTQRVGRTAVTARATASAVRSRVQSFYLLLEHQNAGTTSASSWAYVVGRELNPGQSRNTYDQFSRLHFAAAPANHPPNNHRLSKKPHYWIDGTRKKG